MCRDDMQRKSCPTSGVEGGSASTQKFGFRRKPLAHLALGCSRAPAKLYSDPRFGSLIFIRRADPLFAVKPQQLQSSSLRKHYFDVLTSSTPSSVSRLPPEYMTRHLERQVTGALRFRERAGWGRVSISLGLPHNAAGCSIQPTTISDL